MPEKSDQSNFYKYFLIIPIIILFGALGQWPYGYFILLRWVVTAGAIIVVINAFDKNIDWAKTVFIFIAILFNPIAPVHLSREIWIPIDVVVGAMFIFAYFKVLVRK
jgi:hypothetical protein